jgi:type II secretory pathway predicted ATPase ExeA
VAWMRRSGQRERPRLALSVLQQLLEGGREFLDALALERVGQVVVVDAHALQSLEYPSRLVQAVSSAALRAAVVLVGHDRLLGHRVDGVRAEQLLDVEVSA